MPIWGKLETLLPFNIDNSFIEKLEQDIDKIDIFVQLA